MITFQEYVQLRETSDSWGTTEPAAPVQIMLGPNAPIAGNLTGQKPPNKKEQFGKPPKKRRSNREIRVQPFDDPNKLKRDVERAREMGVDP